jgi:transcriptional regulator with XRE-family HTH domain
MIVKNYLDKCKEKLNISSTYALSKLWDISEQVLSRYYSGEREPEDYACFKIAETLELDAAYVIATIKAETEKNENKKNYFRSFSGASRKIAASVVLTVALSISLLSALGSGITSDVRTAWAVFLRRFHFA